MKLLALDTSMEACSTALFDADADVLLADAYSVPGRGHAELLFAQIEAVIAQSGVALRDVDRFAVTIGPGTFTGMRIALAAARGLALAAKRPLIGIGSLVAIAGGIEPATGEILVVAVDARRGELYVQPFANGRALGEPIVARIDQAAFDLTALAADKCLVLIGSGASILGAELNRRNVDHRVLAGESFPRASVVARLAVTIAPSETSPVPHYLRAPDAKLPASARGAPT